MVRPYPYQSWPKAGRGELSATPEPAAAFTDDRWAAARATARRLLGVDCTLSRGLPGPQPQLVGAQVRVQLHYAAEPQPWLLSIPAPLAAYVADRALGGDGEGAAAASLPAREPALDPMSAGALAYALARILASLGGKLTFDGFLDATQWTERVHGGLVATALSVTVGETGGQCFVWCAHGAVQPVRVPTLRAPVGRIPLTLRAVVGHAVLRVSQLRTVSVGDVVTLDAWTMDPDGTGETQLWAVGARRALMDGALAPGAIRIVAIHKREEFAMGNESEPEPQRGRALAELTGDAPVELQVELARFDVPLERLLELRAGELLSTGRAVGSRVALVAAGRVVATGELVDIEGTVGVRVTEVAGTKTGREESNAAY